MPDGQVFESITAFCNHYQVNRQKVYARLRNGVDLEQLSQTELRNTEIRDHKGNLYPSTRQLCKAYGVSHPTFCRRRDAGMTMEEILTTPSKGSKIDIEALTKGEFLTIKEFAKANNLSYTGSCAILSAGGSLEECLKTRHREPVVDHLGYHYDSITAMCEDYDISIGTYNNRRRAGLSLEEILTTPIKKYRTKKRRLA